jgi:hypothetical protein
MRLQPAPAFISPSETIYSEVADRQARAALQSAGYRALWDLDCRLVDGAIVLSGKVPSYYLKQVAQTVVLRLATAWRVDNCVSVEGK